MFIRCAFFQGQVRPGHEEAFTRYVREQLVPLWTQFPGAEEVRVLRQLESDVADPRFEMVLSIRYPSRAAIEVALASEVRQRSREVSKGLLEMFDGTVFHTVFEAGQAAMPLAPP
jgi:antibiotic biosynthesis monooxygenase (ABM) superfamily enzyme